MARILSPMTDERPWWETDPILPGDFYEDCRWRPVLCVSADYADDDELVGISLIDGTLGSCSPHHCGPEKLTAAQAIERRLHWDEFRRDEIPRLVAEINGLVPPDPKIG